jgi:hypothetical protein
MGDREPAETDTDGHAAGLEEGGAQRLDNLRQNGEEETEEGETHQLEEKVRTWVLFRSP